MHKFKVGQTVYLNAPGRDWHGTPVTITWRGHSKVAGNYYDTRTADGFEEHQNEPDLISDNPIPPEPIRDERVYEFGIGSISSGAVADDEAYTLAKMQIAALEREAKRPARKPGHWEEGCDECGGDVRRGRCIVCGGDDMISQTWVED